MIKINRKFGIEIEFYGISTHEVRKAMRKINVPMTASRTRRKNHWTLVHDVSVQEEGHEIVSPILKGKKGLREACKVAKALREAGAKVDATCGLHVHIDASDLNGAQMKNILLRYAKYENEIEEFFPVSRKESEYSRSVTRYIDDQSFLWRTEPQQIAIWCDHYDCLSLESYMTHGTIEFRHHSGTLSAEKIETWVLFIQNFVQVSKDLNMIEENAFVKSLKMLDIGRAMEEKLRFAAEKFLNASNRMMKVSKSSLMKNLKMTEEEIHDFMKLFEKVFEVEVMIENRSYRVLPYDHAECRLYQQSQSSAFCTNLENENDTGLWMDFPASLQSFYQERAMEMDHCYHL